MRKEVLEAMAGDHFLPGMVVEIRKIDKILGTFIKGTIYNNISSQGRIHCDMNALRSDGGGAVTGRMSSSNPNMQQIPSRDPWLGPLVRGFFVAEHGHVWGAFDYSSQEPRLLCHYANAAKLKGAAEAANYYHTNKDADFHQIVADMCGIKRKPAKAINLGLSYGMGNVKLCRELGLPTEWIDSWDGTSRFEVPGEEGKALFKLYHERVPFVGALSEMCMNRANQKGFIRTLLGRKCRFPDWEPIKWTEGAMPLPYDEAVEEWGEHAIKRAKTYKALNSLCQSSAADQTKAAMLALWKSGITPMLQVHDELACSISSKEEAEKIIDIMEHAVELSIPSKVDCEVAPSWGRANAELFGDQHNYANYDWSSVK